MRKITLFILCCGFQLHAQTSKVGTIDIDYILSVMPELEQVQVQVTEYAGGLESELQNKMKNLEQAVATYRQNEDTYTINQKKTKQDSLLALETEMKQYQQNGNQLLALKQEEFMQPLYTKIGTVLERVAEADGYTQVLLRDNTVVYIDNRFDLTLQVIKEMGIELKVEE
ncbi:MAG: OmpH family outer membrane protein [Flavobacteriaceae bacterium]|jgi:outer membrane protein|nr:OmpH family outer membrane protein [Flavobacteriaceae bacterium]MDG1961507.1 OmpH family outer membrane protein [Flavobacteriaceae bacterium]